MQLIDTFTAAKLRELRSLYRCRALMNAEQNPCGCFLCEEINEQIAQLEAELREETANSKEVKA